MILKWKNRTWLLDKLGPVAQLALVLAVILGRLENPSLDFLCGALIGFSIVGNLVYLYRFGKRSGKVDYWKE